MPQIRGSRPASSIPAARVPSSSAPTTTTPSPPPSGERTSAMSPWPFSSDARSIRPSAASFSDERVRPAHEDRQLDRRRVGDVAIAHDERQRQRDGLEPEPGGEVGRRLDLAQARLRRHDDARGHRVRAARRRWCRARGRGPGRRAPPGREALPAGPRARSRATRRTRGRAPPEDRRGSVCVSCVNLRERPATRACLSIEARDWCRGADAGCGGGIASDVPRGAWRAGRESPRAALDSMPPRNTLFQQTARGGLTLVVHAVTCEMSSSTG